MTQLFDSLCPRLDELEQKLATPPEERPQEAGDSQDDVAVGDGSEKLGAEPFGPEETSSIRPGEDENGLEKPQRVAISYLIFGEQADVFLRLYRARKGVSAFGRFSAPASGTRRRSNPFRAGSSLRRGSG